MPRWLSFPCLISLAFCLGIAPAFSQGIDRYLLSEAEFMALPQAARAHYSEAVQALDHIDYQGAHSELRRAAELAPDSAAIQFKLGELSRRQGRLNSGRRSEDYLVVALEALQRVIDSPASSPSDVQSAEREMRSISSMLDQSNISEQQRLQSGRIFLHAIMLENDWRQANALDTDMEPAIMIEAGGGPPIMRASVVLINRIGYLYNPDESPFIRDGEHLAQAAMTSATFEKEPEAGFFQGVVEETQVGDLPDAFTVTRQDTFSSALNQMDDESDDDETMDDGMSSDDFFESTDDMTSTSDDMDLTGMSQEELEAMAADMFREMGIEGDPATMTDDEIDAAVEAAIAESLANPENFNINIEFTPVSDEATSSGDDPFANPFNNM